MTVTDHAMLSHPLLAKRRRALVRVVGMGQVANSNSKARKLMKERQTLMRRLAKVEILLVQERPTQVYLVVDENGSMAWVPSKQLKILDTEERQVKAGDTWRSGADFGRSVQRSNGKYQRPAVEPSTKRAWRTSGIAGQHRKRVSRKLD
jgi:hypothetical protein